MNYISQKICGTEYFPPGKTCAIVLSIDDIHPSTSNDAYEAGGDMEKGALKDVLELQTQQPDLGVTLFVTADWRQISPFPTRLTRHIPILKDHFYQTKVLKKGTMSLENHQQFCQWLSSLNNIEIAWHGLHHVAKGSIIGKEFQNEKTNEHLNKLNKIKQIFESAGVKHANGFCPPVWNATPELVEALSLVGNEYLASSRDIMAEISDQATCDMTGITGTPLIHACRVGSQVHIPSNFQATSAPERAMKILELGGILSVKGHIIKQAFGHVALDAMDATYCNYLNLLFDKCSEEFGENIWWTTMGEINQRIRELNLLA